MTHRTLTASTLLALALLSGCDNDPGAGKPRATVTDGPSATAGSSAKPSTSAKASSSAAAPAAAGKAFAFSNTGSKVEFVGAKITGKHDGSFGTFTGKLDVVSGDPTKSSVSVDIDAASITSDSEKLTGHLKSADFFDVEKFPKATFQSTSIVAGTAGTHTVTGALNLHGVTKTISFPATISVSDGEVKVDAEFVINRKDFGVVYAGKPDDLIKDDVAIKLTIRATPAAG